MHARIRSRAPSTPPTIGPTGVDFGVLVLVTGEAVFVPVIAVGPDSVLVDVRKEVSEFSEGVEIVEEVEEAGTPSTLK